MHFTKIFALDFLSFFSLVFFFWQEVILVSNFFSEFFFFVFFFESLLFGFLFFTPAVLSCGGWTPPTTTTSAGQIFFSSDCNNYIDTSERIEFDPFLGQYTILWVNLLFCFSPWIFFSFWVWKRLFNLLPWTGKIIFPWVLVLVSLGSFYDSEEQNCKNERQTHARPLVISK